MSIFQEMVACRMMDLEFMNIVHCMRKTKKKDKKHEDKID